MPGIGRLSEHWQLKLLSVVFAVALWAFVTAEDRGEAIFTVPIELVDRPPGIEVVSLGVETVVIRVEGLRTVLDRLREEDFHATLSLKDARPGRWAARILSTDVAAPHGVRVVRVTPSEVRALLAARPS